MSRFIKQIIGNDRLNQLILIGLLVVSGMLTFLYWQKNTLAIYDASGHLSAVESMRGFWPLPSGWNAWEFLGWPQGVFYPSLFHYLAAGLSFLVGTATAVKLLITAAFLALPFSIYIFARSIIVDRTWRGLATLIIFTLILFSPDFLGSNVRSLFHIGLLPNFFVLPLVFLLLASVLKVNSRNFPLAGVLLALLVLTHLVAGIIGAFYLVMTLVVKVLFREKHFWLPIVLVFVIAVVLTAFFWLPFIVYHQYTSVATHGVVSSYLWPNLIVVAASSALLFFSFKEKKGNIFVLSLASGAITALAIADSILFKRLGRSFFLETANIYRFQIFAYIFLVLSLSSFSAEQERLERSKNIVKIGAALIFVLIVLGLVIKNPADFPAAKVSLENKDKISGRFLETFRRTESFPVVYEFQTRFEKENPESSWAFGVFPESSVTAPFVQSLIKSLRPEAYPEGEGAALETKFVDEARTKNYLNLFGVNYLISLDDEKKNAVGTWSSGGDTKYYNMEKISDTGLFEVVKLPLVPVEKDWNQSVEAWWLEKGAVKKLPYLAKKGQTSPVCTEGLENTQVKVISVNSKQTRFELEIASEKKAPVLSKISYFPYWKAYSDGKEIPIYRAAPNLMLIYANGKVTLEYKEPFWVKGLYIVSGVTLLVVTLYFFRKNQCE
jgi:hypothetical protein